MQKDYQIKSTLCSVDLDKVSYSNMSFLWGKTTLTSSNIIITVTKFCPHIWPLNEELNVKLKKECKITNCVCPCTDYISTL